MDTHVHDVIIVGAGAAGLAAAHELKQRGISDVVVVEAQDYIGGRIRTSTAYGDPVELGAEFVHGKRGAAWSYIDQLNLPTLPAGGAPKLVARGGNQLTIQEYAQYMHLHKLVASHGIYGVPVSEIIEIYRGDIPQRVVNLVKVSIGDYEAGDVETLDSGAYTEMRTLTSHNGGNYVLSHGYRELIDFLARGVRILSSAPVRIVDTTDPHKIEVMLDTGERMYAKNIIVTVSLGVLKHGDIRFLPSLPAEKQRAIRRLGMGRVCKLLLYFRTGQLVKELFHVADGENASLQTVSCWWQSASNHKVLIGYAGGERHDRIVSMQKQELLKAVTHDLGRLVGRDISGEIIKYALVRWDTNPYVRGAYSNHPVGVGSNERALLARPVDGRLYFAGEATVISGNYATVHGAIESGQYAAQQMLDAFKG